MPEGNPREHAAGDCDSNVMSSDFTSHGEIKYARQHSPYKLYCKCPVLPLISGCHVLNGRTPSKLSTDNFRSTRAGYQCIFSVTTARRESLAIVHLDSPVHPASGIKLPTMMQASSQKTTVLKKVVFEEWREVWKVAKARRKGRARFCSLSLVSLSARSTASGTHRAHRCAVVSPEAKEKTSLREGKRSRQSC
eukprot:1807333-Rhodomonas_salina.3